MPASLDGMKRAVVLFFLTILTCAPALAREWNVHTPCADAGLSEEAAASYAERGWCDAAELRLIHEAFAAPPIRDVAGFGQAVRITVIDDYDRPIVVAEIVRARGRSARAIVRGARPPASREVELSDQFWAEVARNVRRYAGADAPAILDRFTPIADGAHAGRRQLAVQDQDEEEEAIVICSHGWTALVETYGLGRPRTIRRDGCDPDRVAYEMFWSMVESVFAAMPDCDRLDPYFFRNDMLRLNFCLALSGDIGVAAGGVNAAQPFFGGEFSSDRMPFVTADDFSLRIHDAEPVQGRDQALAAWRAVVATGDYRIYFDRAIGSDSPNRIQRVQMDLILVDFGWADETSNRSARVKQHWRRDNAFWELESMEVGAFEITPDD